MMTNKPPNNAPIRIVVRIALIVILAIVAVAVMRDSQARSGANAAYKKLDDRLEEMDSSPSTDEFVHELLGRLPDESYAGEDKTWIEHYRWKGVFRDYTLTVRYSVAAARLMRDITLQ